MAETYFTLVINHRRTCNPNNTDVKLVPSTYINQVRTLLSERGYDLAERQKNTETLMLMIMQTSRATNVLAEATARAVQRIPDAHCNGDMTAALERAARIQKEEQQFLIDQGVKHIFGD